MIQGKRNPFVAREGIPFLLLAALACVLSLRFFDIFLAVTFAFLFFVLYLLFRDPPRAIPPVPLGVVSPVDGYVLGVEQIGDGAVQGQAHCIRIAIDSLGAYTARAPIEGKIMDLRSAAARTTVDYQKHALWIQTDEGDDVVLQFKGYRFGLAPRGWIRFGERVGQGQRCAYLRLARIAELHLPIASTVLVQPGQAVVAGSDLIGKVPHP